MHQPAAARPRDAGASRSERLRELGQGDRLTRAEFERRYRAMPELKKAELIEGVVYMPSPVRAPEHAAPHFRIVGWLFDYVIETDGVDGVDNATLRLDLDNEPQPDAAVRTLPECGGQTTIDPDGYISGDMTAVREVLRRGLESGERRGLVELLQRNRASSAARAPSR